MATVDSQAEDKKEYTSFWDRLTAGNIDEKGSEAYKKWNKSPEAVAAREAEAMRSGANKAIEDSRDAAKAADAEPATPVSEKPVDEVAKNLAEFRAVATNAFMDEKEPGWDTKPDAAVASVAAKPAMRKPVAKPVAKAPAVDPVASTLKAAPVAKPTAVDEIHAAATESAARDQASKIKLPAAQPATLKQKFAADNANIKGVMVDGQPAMRPGSESAPVREPFSKKIGTVRMAGE